MKYTILLLILILPQNIYAQQFGRVYEVVPRFETNDQGDRYIVSDVTVVLPNGNQRVYTVPGGTIGDETLVVDSSQVPRSGALVRLRNDGSIILDFATYSKWNATSINWYADVKYAEMTVTQALNDLRDAALAWYNQTTVNFKMILKERIPDGSGVQKNDRKNIVMFRPTKSPYSSSAIASTFAWTSNGFLVDVDIIGWSGYVEWWERNETCTFGAYLIHVFTHEFGHMAGLKHSTISAATMYPSYPNCSKKHYSLYSDDKLGIQSLYPSR